MYVRLTYNLPIPTPRNSPLNWCALSRWALFHDLADYEQHQRLRSGGFAVADGPVRESRGRVSASVPRARMVSDRCTCDSYEVVSDAEAFYSHLLLPVADSMDANSSRHPSAPGSSSLQAASMSTWLPSPSTRRRKPARLWFVACGRLWSSASSSTESPW
jgi:hypothetical protein